MKCSWHITCALLLLLPWGVKQSSSTGVPAAPAPSPVPSPLDALGGAGYPAWPEPATESKSKETNLMFSGTTHIGSCDQLEELFLDLLDSGNVYSKNPMCFIQENTNTSPTLDPLQQRLFTFYLSTKLPALSDALQTLRKMGLGQGIDVDTFLYSASVPCGSVLVVTTTTEDQDVASVYTYSCNGMLTSLTDSVLLPLPSLCCSSSAQQPLPNAPPEPPEPPALDYSEPPTTEPSKTPQEQQQPPAPAKRAPKPQLTLFVMTSAQNVYCSKLLLACETVAQPYGLTSGQYGCYKSTDEGLPVAARYGKYASVPGLPASSGATAAYVIVTALWPQRMYDRSFKRLQAALASSVEMFASLGLVPCGTEVRGVLLDTSGSVRREDAFGCLANMPKSYKADISAQGLRPVPRALLCCRPPPRPPFPPLLPANPRPKSSKPPLIGSPPPPGSGLTPSLDPALFVPPAQSTLGKNGPRPPPPPWSQLPRPPSPGESVDGEAGKPGGLLSERTESSGPARYATAIIASLVAAAALSALAAVLLLYRRRRRRQLSDLHKAQEEGQPGSSSFGRSSEESGGLPGGGGSEDAAGWYGIGMALKREGFVGLAMGSKAHAGGVLEDGDGGCSNPLSTRPSGCSTASSSAATGVSVPASGSGLQCRRSLGALHADGAAADSAAAARPGAAAGVPMGGTGLQGPDVANASGNGGAPNDPALLTAAVGVDDSVAIIHAVSIANSPRHERLRQQQQRRPQAQQQAGQAVPTAPGAGPAAPAYGIGGGSGFGMMDVFRDAAYNNSFCLSTATSAAPSALAVGTVAGLACSSWSAQASGGGVYDNPAYQPMPPGLPPGGPPQPRAQPPPQQRPQGAGRFATPPYSNAPKQGAGGPAPGPYGRAGILPEAREVTLLELFNQSPLAGAMLATPSASSGGAPPSEPPSEPASRTASESLARSVDVLGIGSASGVRQRRSPAIALERLSVQLAMSIARLSGGVELPGGGGGAAAAGGAPLASASTARERRLALLLPDGDAATEGEEEEEQEAAAGGHGGGGASAVVGRRRATVGAAAAGTDGLPSSGQKVRVRRWRTRAEGSTTPRRPLDSKSFGRGGGSAGGASSAARGASDLGSTSGDLDLGSRSGSESARSGVAGEGEPSYARLSPGTGASAATTLASAESDWCDLLGPGTSPGFPPAAAKATTPAPAPPAAAHASTPALAASRTAAGGEEVEPAERPPAGPRTVVAPHGPAGPRVSRDAEAADGQPEAQYERQARRGRRSGGGRAANAPAAGGGLAAAGAAGSSDLDISPKELRIQTDGLLGAGSFGSVYRGIYRGQPVAVKVLHHMHFAAAAAAGGCGGAALQQKDVDSFRQEIALLRMLAHPNIVRVLGGCAHAGHPFLVMELLPRCLHNVIHGVNGRLPLGEALRIATDVARGLAHLHPAIVHRDLKPANILLDANGTAKISDFGLARYHLKPYISTQQPDAGSVAYMAPEGFDPAIGRLSAKCDVYSFGVLLWELLTQEHPWSGDSNVAIIYRVAVHRMRLPPPADPRVCPPRLAALLDACMSYRPADRPDMRHVLGELEDMVRLVAAGGVEALLLQGGVPGQPQSQEGAGPGQGQQAHLSDCGAAGQHPGGCPSHPQRGAVAGFARPVSCGLDGGVGGVEAV